MALGLAMKTSLMGILLSVWGVLQADFEFLVGTEDGFLVAEDGDYLNARSSFRIRLNGEPAEKEVALLVFLDAEINNLYQGIVGREGRILPSGSDEYQIEGGYSQLQVLAVYGSDALNGATRCANDVSCYEKVGLDVEQRTFKLTPEKSRIYRGLRDAKIKPKKIDEDQGGYTIEFDASQLSERVKKITQIAKKSSFELPTRGASEVRVYKNTSPSVVLIVGDDSIGSGSIIESDASSAKILTNWHVVEGSKELSVLLKGSKSAPSREKIHIASVVKYDPVVDLALLEVSGPIQVKNIELARPSEHEVGEDVHAIGHPEGEFWSYTKGYISQIREGYKWKTKTGVHRAREIIQTQTPINPGNSGGPLLNDAGKLVGVNSFGTEGEGMNYAISVLDVVDFLKSSDQEIAKKNKKISIQSKVLEKKKVDLDDDGKNELVIIIDRNLNGDADGAIIVDGESKSRIVLFDDDENGVPETMLVDEDANEIFEAKYEDEDQDEKMDRVYLDSDQDGHYERMQQL
jgi:S1-C subfamily serine protease